MLSSIKAKIEEVEDLSFAQFFQEYVMTLQDTIINKQIRNAIDCVNRVEASVAAMCNRLTEDM